MALDRDVMQFLVDHRSATVTKAARGVMTIGTNNDVLFAFALVGLAYVLFTRRWQLGIAVGLALIGSGVIATIGKDLIDRPRPSGRAVLVHNLGGSSMPSSHAARTAAVAVAVVASTPFLSRRVHAAVTATLIAAVALVGLCMLYLGGHWLSDVLAGWVLGSVIGAVAARIGGRIERATTPPPYAPRHRS